jgi:RelA/SpoT family (p)ppGpp synthetase
VSKKRFFSPSPEKAMRGVVQRCLGHYLAEDKIQQIFSAFYFAEKAHRGQVRRTGEHYIHHPIQVADTLGELQMDACSIMAALLHDVIEDTPVTKQEVLAKFGDDVALLVDGVTKIGKINFESKEQAEAENFRKMLMAMSQDVRVMIIKLADRLHNMRTLSVMSPEKQRKISKQTLEIYAPIAERLGLYHWARELQDLCFRHLYPKRHDAIYKAVIQREGNRKAVVQNLRDSLQTTLDDSAISNFKILGRRKSVYSIYKKMVKKRRSFDELFDIYGFRIIVDTVDDCYRTLGIIHNTYKPIPGRFVDYIAIPKVNGYQSLHTVVFGPMEDNIEVQIRTRKMDRIAEAGVAAHWVYKSDDDLEATSNHLARQWLLDLLDPAHQTGNPVEFLEHLKTDLYPDEVYVFTPKGDIKKLPRGATALDFAYSVHTDVGNHCTGARINRALASMPTVLENGDSVEIITSKRSWPTTAWLNYVVTARARIAIRNFLKNQTEGDAIKLGKRLLAGATKQRLFGRRAISAIQKNQLLSKLNIDTWDELLADIGMGHRLPDMVARQLAQLSGKEDAQDGTDQEQSLVIRGSEGLLVSYSKCCYPVPGDSILGTFTAGTGLAVHTADCPNIAEMRKQPERCLMVDWDEDIDQEFNAKLQVLVRNVKGAFADVATAIAELETNITHVDLNEKQDATHQIEFLIEVKNRVHLAQVLKAIRKQDKVIKVLRPKG